MDFQRADNPPRCHGRISQVCTCDPCDYVVTDSGLVDLADNCNIEVVQQHEKIKNDKMLMNH